jgi:hypothetical protein
LEKAEPARLKVNIGQRNGNISSFLDVYRMDKIRDISDEQEQLIRPEATHEIIQPEETACNHHSKRLACAGLGWRRL